MMKRVLGILVVFFVILCCCCIFTGALATGIIAGLLFLGICILVVAIPLAGASRKKRGKNRD